MRETERLELTKARLEELGFTVEIDTHTSVGSDARITLTRNGNQETLDANVRAKVTLSAIRPDILEQPAGKLLIADRINAKTAATFRRFGVQFVDSTGTVFLSSPRWIIDVRGSTDTPYAVKAVDDTETIRIEVGNLYSAKRAQVLFAILVWPQLLDAPLREVGKCAGVSLGLVQSTLSALRNEWDLWPADPGRRRRLIDSWAAAYPSQLGPSLHIGTFHSADPFASPVGVLVSGESAVPELLRPSRLIAYAKKVDAKLVRDNKWRTDANPNVFVRRQFWQKPTRTVLPVQPEISVPPLLIYADLMSSTDPRVRVAAEEFRAQLS